MDLNRSSYRTAGGVVLSGYLNENEYMMQKQLIHRQIILFCSFRLLSVFHCSNKKHLTASCSFNLKFDEIRHLTGSQREFACKHLTVTAHSVVFNYCWSGFLL